MKKLLLTINILLVFLSIILSANIIKLKNENIILKNYLTEYETDLNKISKEIENSWIIKKPFRKE